MIEFYGEMGFLIRIPGHNIATVEAVIIENVVTGFIIYRNMWRSYNNLSKLGYTMEWWTIQKHFVNRDMGVGTKA